MTDTDTMPGTGAGTPEVGRATPSSESPPSLDCDDIVDLTEIAKRAGTTPGTVRSWRYRHPEFPQPVAMLAVGPVWRWADVEPWLATRRKR
jgi:predicted DNA-binding transcriptional regulator AlpA